MIYKALKAVYENTDDTATLVTSGFLGDRWTKLEVPYTQVMASVEQLVSGTLIQHAFPYLTEEQRELILTGMNDEEWERALKEENL